MRKWPLEKNKRDKTLADLLVIFIVGGVLYLMAIRVHVHQMIDKWTDHKNVAGLKFDEFLVVLAYFGVALTVFSLRRWTEFNREIKERRRIEERIIKQSHELATKNMELSALFNVSSAISSTIDMKALFHNILDAITEIDVLKVKRKGGIFLKNGEKLNLVAHLGHSEHFLKRHHSITVNECLCGLAARTGEIIISNNAQEDRHHTVSYPDMHPHGHIIIPLKVVNDVVGVLYLYLPPDTHADENIIKSLAVIGNQVGTAINNSMLYEETKELSLHDPLTGLANRRLLSIVFKRNLERASRLGEPFSMILMDLDNFKNYNDAHGHNEGDRLLAEVANIMSNEVRGLDIVARYGGEEFLILLPETELTSASKVA